jgi:hypothetical protein
MEFVLTYQNASYDTYQCQYADTTYTIVHNKETNEIMDVRPYMTGSGGDIVAEAFRRYLN